MTWPLSGISIIPLAVLAGLACLVAFAVVELRRKRAGGFYLFDFDLWREPTFRFGNLTATIVSLGEFGLLFALPLFLQAVIGYTAFETGLVFLTLAAGLFVAAPLAGMLAGRFEPRRTVQVGMLLEVVGILGVTLLLSNTVSGLTLAVPFFLYGMGVGFSTAQLANVILSDIPPERSGLASATNSTMRQVGTALGSAILGTVLLVGLNTGTHDRLAQVPGLPSAQAQAIAISIEESAGQALVGLRSEPAAQVAIGPIEDAFVAAARTVGIRRRRVHGPGTCVLAPSAGIERERTAHGGRDRRGCEARGRGLSGPHRAGRRREDGRGTRERAGPVVMAVQLPVIHAARSATSCASTWPGRLYSAGVAGPLPSSSRWSMAA